MASLFLDTNFLIDIAERQAQITLELLEDHFVYISPLSFHILAYSYKYKIPYEKFTQLTEYFHLVSLDESIVRKSLKGPMADFEDNIQLHSAVEADCDYLLTSDRKLLAMKFFGKARIVHTLPIKI